MCTMIPQRRDCRLQSFPSFYNPKWHGARALPDCHEHAVQGRQNVLCSPPSGQIYCFPLMCYPSPSSENRVAREKLGKTLSLKQHQVLPRMLFWGLADSWTWLSLTASRRWQKLIRTEHFLHHLQLWATVVAVPYNNTYLFPRSAVTKYP